MAEQVPASPPNPPERDWLNYVGAWGLANALNQKFELERAFLRDAMKTDVAPIPFGNNIQVVVPQPQVKQEVPQSSVPCPPVSQPAPEGWIAKFVPMLLAGLVGGFGVAAFNRWESPKPTMPQPLKWETKIEFIPDKEGAKIGPPK